MAKHTIFADYAAYPFKLKVRDPIDASMRSYNAHIEPTQ